MHIYININDFSRRVGILDFIKGKDYFGAVQANGKLAMINNLKPD